MTSVTKALPLNPADVTTLAEVLFCSSLQPSDRPDADRVRAAVMACLRAYDGDVNACVGELAQRYGKDPDCACTRMRWCRETAARALAAFDAI
jgi:hypothetical protein